MSTDATTDLDELRERRHRLSQEVTRLSWLRRLVVARSDLEVARLTGVRAEVHEVPASVRAALEAVPDVLGPELLADLAGSARILQSRAREVQAELDAATRELVARYTVDPARCLPVPPA
ncbi:hypothetical protein [Angustibacter aerolatus]